MALVRSLDTRPHRGLLRLPVELRTQILSIVLVDYDPQGSRHNLPYFPNSHYLTANDGTFKPPRRDLSLFRVNKQIRKEAIRIFYRKNEFHFCCFLCFSQKMLGGFPDDWDAEFNCFELDVELRVDYSRRPSLPRRIGKGDHRQMIRHLSLVGDRWWDHHAFAEDSVDVAQKEGLRQYSSVIAHSLLHFPNLRKLDLLAALVETFSDWRGEVGQIWAPVLNILRRNRGTLGVVWQDFLHHRHGPEQEYFFEREIRLHKEGYMDGHLCAETKIELPVRMGKKLPLRETIFAVSDLELAVREIVGTAAPGVHLYGERNIIAGPGRTKHTIRFSGIPEYLADEFEHSLNKKEQALRKNAAVQGLDFQVANCNCWTCVVGGRQFSKTPCPCCNCNYPVEKKMYEWDWYDRHLGEEFNPEDEVWEWDYVPSECWRAAGGYYVRRDDDQQEVGRLGTGGLKKRRKAFRKRWGGRVPKWARGPDVGVFGEEMWERGVVS
ncbi:hypothetical protein Vi05172_g645 [Venturia inaequalis]|nr:hypothetical protein Vi05172_g645 [Venturia inaequalis]